MISGFVIVVMLVVTLVGTGLQVVSLRGDVRFMKPAYIGALLLATALCMFFILSLSSQPMAIGSGFLAGYIVRPMYVSERFFGMAVAPQRRKILNEFARRVLWLHVLAGVAVLALATLNVMAIPEYGKEWSTTLVFGGTFAATMLVVSWRRRR